MYGSRTPYLLIMVGVLHDGTKRQDSRSEMSRSLRSSSVGLNLAPTLRYSVIKLKTLKSRRGFFEGHE